jgi:Uma2 family endonuclease
MSEEHLMEHAGAKMTTPEYLEWSLTAEFKHEFVNGELIAMSGGTALHAAVAANLLMELGVRLRGKPCRPTTSDQRLYVDDTDAYFYPDVQVICGRYQFRRSPGDAGEFASDGLSVTNPTMIAEVLSTSTRSYDLGEKWAHYRRIPSLQSYLIVDPERRSALHYARNEAGWQLTEHDDGEVRVSALDVSLPLADIFGNLEALL